MAGSILGTRVLRTEDPELLVGAGRFVDDLQLDQPLHVVFVRSEMAHARLLDVDVSEAMTMPGPSINVRFRHENFGASGSSPPSHRGICLEPG